MSRTNRRSDAQLVAPVAMSLVDRSGSVASGGVAQTAAPPNLDRAYLVIQNKSAAGGSFWVDFGTDAVADSPSLEVLPGMGLFFEAGFVPADRVSVVASAGGAKYTIKEG